MVFLCAPFHPYFWRIMKYLTTAFNDYVARPLLAFLVILFRQVWAIVKRKPFAIIGIILVFAVGFSLAPPQIAHAATSIPGSIYTPASGSGLYKNSDRLACPSNSSSIADCRFFGEVSGSSYDAITKNMNNAPNIPSPAKPQVSEAPFQVYAIANLDYNPSKVTTQRARRSLILVAPVDYDKNTGKVFYTFDFSDFYFDDWTTDSSNQSYSWGLSNTSAPPLNSPTASTTNYGNGTLVMTGNNTSPALSSPNFGGTYSTPEVCASSFNNKPSLRAEPFIHRSFLTCLDYKLAPTQAPPVAYDKVFNKDNASSILGLSISLFKVPTLASPDPSSGKLMLSWTGSNVPIPDTRQVPLGGFPAAEAYPYTRSSCTVSNNDNFTRAAGFGIAQINTDAVLNGDAGPNPMSVESRSAAKVWDYINTIPVSSSCWESNHLRYDSSINNVVANILDNPARTITPEQIDKFEREKIVTKPVAEEVYQRPDFTSCININPLEFKWDWPCVFESLFIASQSSVDEMNSKTQNLMTLFPFNYAVMLFDASNKVFAPQGACVPFGVEVIGWDIPIFPCNAEFRAVFRPITTWGFTLIIALNAGSYIIRKLMPGVPGEK